MKTSEMINLLQNLFTLHGDVNVFCGDMKPTCIAVEQSDPECTKTRGQTYVYLGEV